jgi:hypothetical protein
MNCTLRTPSLWLILISGVIARGGKREDPVSNSQAGIKRVRRARVGGRKCYAPNF